MQTPGEEIRKQIIERNWTQADLARIIERPLQTVNAIIKGKKTITPEMAVSLAAAFGTKPEKWMKLELEYRLSLTKTNPKKIEKRARLYDYAPIKDMEKRGWIPCVTSNDEQERVLCRFFEINSLNEEPQINVATRKPTVTQNLTAEQKAWCFRAKHLGKTLQVSPLKKSALKIASQKLRELAAFPEEARHIPKMLADCGIRFLVIEPLHNCKMDGATIWLDEDSPIIALSIRYDRIDAFWFTLLHELCHVIHEDASIDDDLFGEGQLPSIAKVANERKADLEASDTLVPSEKLNSFVLRVSPLYSKKRIIQFAHTVQIHPGIIVGQLQYRGEIGYSANREMLVKIRDIVANSALTDGWGRSVSIGVN